MTDREIVTYHGGDPKIRFRDFKGNEPIWAEDIQPEPPSKEAENPGGWLIKDFADGWFWTPHRIAAVAALTEGHAVYSLKHDDVVK